MPAVLRSADPSRRARRRNHGQRALPAPHIGARADPRDDATRCRKWSTPNGQFKGCRGTPTRSKVHGAAAAGRLIEWLNGAAAEEKRQLSSFDETWRMADELSDVVPILTLTEDERRQIVSRMRVRRFDERDVVYYRHDPGDDLFVVHRGLVKSVLHLADGREFRIALYSRGEFFGTLQLFDENARRDTTVIATTPTTVLQIAADDARRVLSRNFEAMKFLFRRETELTRRLMRALAGLVSFSVAGRVAWTLIQFATLSEGFTQEDLASAIGATRRAVNGVLADFARRGLVSVEPRRVNILDEERLLVEIRPYIRREDEDEFFRRFDDVLFRDT